MASFKIARGLSTKLPTTKVDGAIYFCTDTHELYIDYKNSNNTIVRVGINASQLEGATLAQELKNSTSEIPSSALISSIKSALENSIAGVSSSLSTHTANKSNPHGVTKSQVGLGNVDNTSDANKPVSTAQATAIANAKTEALNASSAVSEALSAHTSNKNNPHGVTLSQLGGQSAITGAASTVTDSNLTASRVLVSNSSGKIAASSSITTTELGYLDGVTSKIQTQLDSKASGEALLAHIADTDNPHSVTKAQIGLGDVENKSSATIRDELTKSNVTTALGYTPPTTDTTYSKVTTTSDGLMSKEDKIKLDYTNIAYARCDTEAETAEKEIVISGDTTWELTVGSLIAIKFRRTNTAREPKFNINGTGAKSVWYNTERITRSNLNYAGYQNRPMLYMYDGTYYVFIGQSYDADSIPKNAALGQGYATCSTAAATVAKTASLSSYSLENGGIVSVKFTYDVPASATLNVNSEGAKSIYYRGAAIADGIIKAGDTATFIYSTYYHLISIDRWQDDIVNINTTLDNKIDVLTFNNAMAEITAIPDSEIIALFSS